MPVEEVMRGLDDLIRQGKVLHIGISDAPAWWIAQANTLAQLRGWSPFVGLQIEYSLIERTVERDLVPMAKAMNLGLTAWSPLAGGMLTGKYHGHGSSEKDRMNGDMMKDFMPEQQRTDRVVSAVKAVSDQTGQKHGASRARMAALPPGSPVIPIIGARKLSQLQDNLASLRPGAFGGTSKGTRRGEPNRSRIPISILRQRTRPHDCVRWHARPDLGLGGFRRSLDYSCYMTNRFRLSAMLSRRLEELGLSPVAVLRHAGLPIDLLDQEKESCSLRKRCLAWTAPSTRSAAIPRSGSNSEPKNASSAIIPPRSQRSILVPFVTLPCQRLARYKQITSPEEIQITEHGNECAVQFLSLLTHETQPAAKIDCCFAWIVEIGSRGTGRTVHPKRVEFQRPESHRKMYESHFRCPVKFGARNNVLVFDRADIDRPFLTHNSRSPRPESRRRLSAN